MKLITRSDLAGVRESELRSLLGRAFNELSKSNPDTHESRNTLASIENIQSELNASLRP